MLKTLLVSLISLATFFEPNEQLKSKTTLLYGVTSDGGVHKAGVLYGYDVNKNTFAKVAYFDSTTGKAPYGSLAFYKGKYYGMCREGGSSDHGTIYEYNPATNKISAKFLFDGENGNHPLGKLVLHDNKFWGLTQSGGKDNAGVIFQWNPETNECITKASFEEKVNGRAPMGQLTFFEGKFYGLTYIGGRSSKGAIFSFDPMSNTLALEASFSGDNGRTPYGSLIVYKDQLYGTCYKGGKYDQGCVFSFNPKADYKFAEVERSLDGKELGGVPMGNISIYNDKMYMLTNGYGRRNCGVILQLDVFNDLIEVKYNFDCKANGGSPYGTLTLFNNKFYGTTGEGGLDAGGVLFEWDPTTNTYTKKLDFSSIGAKDAKYAELVFATK